MIHGTERNARDYFSCLQDLDTLVIAPQFQASGPGMYWSSSWKEGSKSSDPQHVSSYEVLDRLVEMFHGVAIVGHSAGAQFGTRLQGLTFIVANPSSYLYLDRTRPVSGACSGFNNYRYGLDHLNSYMRAVSTAASRACSSAVSWRDMT